MKKLIFNYNPEEIIKANLELQTIQNILKKDFGLINTNFNNIVTYFDKYKTWPEDKKNKFIVTLGGRANFKKTKNFIENKINL